MKYRMPMIGDGSEDNPFRAKWTDYLNLHGYRVTLTWRTPSECVAWIRPDPDAETKALLDADTELEQVE